MFVEPMRNPAVRGLILLLALLVGAPVVLSPAMAAANPVVVQSPDGHLKAELSAAGGSLRYRILLDGRPLLAPSRLGIRADGTELGEDVTLGAARVRPIHETYRFFGAHDAVALAVDRVVGERCPRSQRDGDRARRILLGRPPRCQ